MRWFSRLFKQQHTVSEKLDSVHDVRAFALLSFIRPQLNLLGLNQENVPVTGSFISKRSRGYIYGMAAAVAGATAQEGEQSEDAYHDVLEAAFILVWGREMAKSMFNKTFSECVARDGQTLAGAYCGEADVSMVYAGKPYASVMGFWLLNNGLNNPEEIMPEIKNPPPLPEIQ
jgi:hypothetical protein